LSVKISNLNTGAIQITSVALNGTITLDVGGGHCDSSFVTWNGTQGGNFGSVAGGNHGHYGSGAVHLAGPISVGAHRDDRPSTRRPGR
jgi:hypothetical protein